MVTHLDRRTFLAGMLGAGVGLALTGCSKDAPPKAAARSSPVTASQSPPVAAVKSPPGGQTGSPLDRVEIDPTTVVGKEGFFRVAKSKQGRWWLLGADGKPMLYRGVCALFMPDNGVGSEAAALRKNWEAKNGKDKDKLAAYCLGILSELKFNALGEWATLDLYADRGWPFTNLIHVRSVRKESNITGKLPDIFDPAWQKAYDAACKAACTPYVNNRNLVGYFVDNEGTWYQARKDFVWGLDKGPLVDKNVLGMEPLLLQMFLCADPKHPGHQAAWDWVLKRHGGEVARVAKDWGADFDSPAKLSEMHAKGLALASKAYAADQDAFTTFFVQEYFRLTSEAIRRYDTNHLLLGCRYGGPPGDVVMKACDRRHVDVISFNNYRPNFKERAEEYYKHTQMPMLNGEYSWASGGFVDWNKIVSRATFTPEEREKCRRIGTHSLENAFTHPGLVGYTWYKFCCKFPTPDDPTYGLVDPTGQFSRFSSEMLTRINARLEGIATGEIQPAEG